MRLRSRYVPPVGIRRSKRLATNRRRKLREFFSKRGEFKQLDLYLKPSPTVTSYPDLDKLVTVPLVSPPDCMVNVLLNNHQTCMYVDSGSDLCFLSYDEGCKFGLHDYIVGYQYRTVNTNYGRHSGYFARLKNVPVEFDNGVTIYINMFMFPEGVGSDTFEFPFIGIDALVGYRAVMSYTPSTVSLHFKDSKLLNRPLPRTICFSPYFLHAQPRRYFWYRDPMKVLVDTGSTRNILASQFCRSHLVPSHFRQIRNQGFVKVVFHMSLTNTITKSFGYTDYLGTDGILMGQGFLSDHQGVLDFSDRLLYLRTKGKTYRTVIPRECKITEFESWRIRKH